MADACSTHVQLCSKSVPFSIEQFDTHFNRVEDVSLFCTEHQADVRCRDGATPHNTEQFPK
jgi:hypothetical protein